ncbi:MAG: hypothetical protein IT247_07790 [Bacteroidia bacterium]|nr:hypothetical protein [Bacteroidia bacterium]
MTKRKRAKDMTELTKNHEKFMQGKEVNPEGAELFERVLKAAVKPKRAKK